MNNPNRNTKPYWNNLKCNPKPYTNPHPNSNPNLIFL